MFPLKYFRVFLVVCLGLLVTASFSAKPIQASDKVVIQMFSRDDCTHCRDQKEFLQTLSQKRSDFSYEVLDLDTPENKDLWEELAQLDNLPKVTPITIVGKTIIQGFGTAETTGVRIEELIDFYHANPSQIQGFQDYIELGGGAAIETVDEGTCTEECVVPPPQQTINIPFLGSLNIAGFSLPALSALLGFIDGFNPCAMWVLVTFLLILAQLKSRQKVLLYAGIFIVAEAIMYTLILTAWYSTWNFVQLDRIVTPLVGLVALCGGIFFLYEFKTYKAGECKVTNGTQRKKLRDRIKKVVNQPLSISTILGILLIAFSVNVIEFACSIGIPQTFTKILELNNISQLYSGFLIGIYILMYMVDDLIVFGLALYSFDKIGLTAKYSKLSNLLGGVLLIILGALLIFRPEWLRLI